MTRRRTLVIAAIVALALVTAGSAISATPPRQISGVDPLPPYGAVGACGSPADLQSWESEPTIAVNPAHPSNVIAAWMQDYADASVVAYSLDGGRRWTTSLPVTTSCTGGASSLNSDINPSLSIGPDGVAYLVSSASHNDGSVSATLVSRSTNGGKTWTAPIALDTASCPPLVVGCAGTAVDWASVTADPRRAGHAWALWGKWQFPSFERIEYVARTTDGGLHWSVPTPVPTPGDATAGHVTVLRDGTLLDVFAVVPNQPPNGVTGVVGPTKVEASRSLDGTNWLPAVPVALADAHRLVYPSTAVAPDGTIYVAWTNTGADGTQSDLMLSSSGDGVVWKPPVALGNSEPGPPELVEHGAVAAPTLAVAANGTIGVTFYDHRSDPSAHATNYWYRSSADKGKTWSEQLVAGPFDQRAAPNDGIPSGDVGYLGAHFGLVPDGDGLAAVFTLAKPLAGANFGLVAPPTDIFFERLPAGRPR